MRDKVTIQQIADVTGVSKYAVSRALSGKSGVSEQTREMILRTAGQLGYFQQQAGDKQHAGEPTATRALPQSGTIVILFPNIRYQNKDSIYWGPIFEGVADQLKHYGIDVITITEPSTDSMFQVLNPDMINGIITLGTISSQMLLAIKNLNIPVVMVDHQDPVFPCDTIFADNITSMRELVTKLISKGYRNMQFVGDIQEAISFTERWMAFRFVMEQYQLNVLQNDSLLRVGDSVQIEEAIVRLEKEQLPDVFVCANDFTAEVVIHTLKQKGLSVPNDCGVTGFDDTCADTDPTLTTVSINKKWMGRRAVDRMLWRLAHPNSDLEKTLIHGEVIVRASVVK